MNKIAVLQLCSSDQVDENLAMVAQQLALASNDGVRLAVLPENFAYMGLLEEDKLQVAETFGAGPIQDAVSEMAKRYQLWLVAGTISIKSQLNGKVYAASLVFNDLGECVARYDKIHLFDVAVDEDEIYKESDSVVAGEQTVCVDSPVGRLGLSVCYDLRFPEHYRRLIDEGAEVLIVPAAFTYKTGLAHWHTLLKARAIENLAFVVASNQTGTHKNQRQTFGHSLIISPWGEVLAEAGDGCGMVASPLDHKKLHHYRRHFPCLTHRKG